MFILRWLSTQRECLDCWLLFDSWWIFFFFGVKADNQQKYVAVSRSSLVSSVLWGNNSKASLDTSEHQRIQQPQTVVKGLEIWLQSQKRCYISHSSTISFYSCDARSKVVSSDLPNIPFIHSFIHSTSIYCMPPVCQEYQGLVIKQRTKESHSFPFLLSKIEIKIQIKILEIIILISTGKKIYGGHVIGSHL